MTALNLRNVPPDLIRRLKSEAALREMTLHDFCIWALEAIVSDYSTASLTARPR